MAMYDDNKIVERSFDLSYISEHLTQAQWAEFIELKKQIYLLANATGRPISILDIGIGNARIAMHLSPIDEIWKWVEKYDGTDNAQACVDITNENIVKNNLNDKVSVTYFDAVNLSQWPKQYDMILTTWFTAGNFYPDGFDFENYAASGARLDLTHNYKFETIFKSAYNLLLPGGQLVIGACYIDNDNTRLKQEEAYKMMGMTVITTPKDSFTATKEGFWSQRFTKEKLYRYLHFVNPEYIEFIPLDTYEFAMQVIIKKG